MIKEKNGRKESWGKQEDNDILVVVEEEDDDDDNKSEKLEKQDEKKKGRVSIRDAGQQVVEPEEERHFS